MPTPSREPTIEIPKKLSDKQKPSKGGITTFGSLKGNDVFSLTSELAEGKSQLYMRLYPESDEISNAVCLADGKLHRFLGEIAVWIFRKAKLTV